MAKADKTKEDTGDQPVAEADLTIEQITRDEETEAELNLIDSRPYRVFAKQPSYHSARRKWTHDPVIVDDLTVGQVAELQRDPWMVIELV